MSCTMSHLSLAYNLLQLIFLPATIIVLTQVCGKKKQELARTHQNHPGYHPPGWKRPETTPTTVSPAKTEKIDNPPSVDTPTTPTTPTTPNSAEKEQNQNQNPKKKIAKNPKKKSPSSSANLTDEQVEIPMEKAKKPSESVMLYRSKEENFDTDASIECSKKPMDNTQRGPQSKRPTSNTEDFGYKGGEVIDNPAIGAKKTTKKKKAVLVPKVVPYKEEELMIRDGLSDKRRYMTMDDVHSDWESIRGGGVSKRKKTVTHSIEAKNGEEKCEKKESATMLKHSEKMFERK